MQKTLNTEESVGENASCKHDITCARPASTKTGALNDVEGVVGPTCVHGMAIPGAYCDMRGPENYVYYVVSL